MASRFKHWRLERDPDRVAWLCFDQAGASANVLGFETLGELERALTLLEEEVPRGLVIRSAKAESFIVGADVHTFAELRERAQALDAIRRGQRIMDRIERLPFPVLAMIHGHCLGGGLELALACRYRLAADEAALGLPEVRLGIHPGFGGSVRLPQLIGPLRAMDLMLSGRSVRGAAAKRLGLVDEVVPLRQLVRGARTLVLQAPPRRGPAHTARLLSSRAVRPAVAAALRRKVARRANRHHYPAPFALVDLWRRHGADRSAMLRAEGESVAKLITGATAQNLVRVFLLQERLKSLGKRAAPEALPARHLHVVGAGAMGGDIAAWAALKGLRVSIEDTRREAIAAAIQRADGLFRKRLRGHRRVQAALDRLCPDQNGDGVAHADVVIEAIAEDAAAKQALFARIERRARPDALLATNTSSIPIEVVASALRETHRLVGLHYFNPVAKMPLVEVVAGPRSGEDALARARRFTTELDRLPLPVRSAPGFLVNRVLAAYLLEAVTLDAEGVPIAHIDRAATEFGMPMGPILLADTVGLDVCLAVAETVAQALGVDVPQRLHSLVSAGYLGVKAGRGFYDHHGKRPQPPASTNHSAYDPMRLQERLVLRLLNEAVACLRAGIVADADLLDAGLVFGTGFAPFRGGPMHYIASEGKDRVVARLERLREREGERFTPDPGWSEVPAQGTAPAARDGTVISST